MPTYARERKRKENQATYYGPETKKEQRTLEEYNKKETK